MTHKILFKDPIVRVKIGMMRFPKSCPVCGAPATASTWITTIPQRKQWLRSHLHPGFAASERRKLGLTLEEKKSFHVHVCEDHDYTDSGEWRFRSLAIILISIIICLSVFIFIFNISSVLNGYGISPFIRSFILVSIVSIIIGHYAFKPNALESAFQIIGFDFDIQYVWLNLKNDSYRKKFLEENQMNAELVNWIIKV